VRKNQQKRKEPPRYDGLCRRLNAAEAGDRVGQGESYVVRFKMPREGSTTAIDLIRGEITVENNTIDDYILLKSNGLPVYHLAAMVDDHLMEITHVFRGSEWLPTFPLHVQIYEAFGWEQPEWVHLSVFLNPTGKGKMSKRHSQIKGIYVLDIEEMGYLPAGIVNWIALMGWSYDDHTEFFTLKDLTEKFSLKKLHASPAAVDFKKLDHFNGLHIRALSIEDLVLQITPFFENAEIDADHELLLGIAPLLRERIRTLDEAVSMAGFFFRDYIEPQADELVGKNMTLDESANAMKKTIETISALSDFTVEPLESSLRNLADTLELKAGQLFGILRIAVTGQPISPPLIESMVIIGKDEVLRRIDQAVNVVETTPT
jgi:glutamyl-tRNA synthetase